MLANNYKTFNVSTQAKQLAKQLINDHQIKDTGQIAFWLDIAVDSDYVALAVFIQRQLDAEEIDIVANEDCADELVALLEAELP